jgi:hypothetical protein
LGAAYVLREGLTLLATRFPHGQYAHSAEIAEQKSARLEIARFDFPSPRRFSLEGRLT